MEVEGPHLCRAEHFSNALLVYFRCAEWVSNRAQYSSSPSLGKKASAAVIMLV